MNLPSAITQPTAKPSLSERYVHINSHSVIKTLEAEGWAVASINTRRTREKDPLYARHSVALRIPGQAPISDRRGGYEPQVLFTNSHDGSSAASVMLGAFAFVCSNGLVVGSPYAAERVRHTGDDATRLLDRVREMAKNSTRLMSQVEAWSGVQLSLPQRRQFARLAGVLRWNDPHRYAPEVLLRPRRAEDDAGDLWSTFNRVQENAIRGGLIGLSPSGRRATSRPLSEISANNQFNANLWLLAEEFSGLKA